MTTSVGYHWVNYSFKAGIAAVQQPSNIYLKTIKNNNNLSLLPLMHQMLGFLVLLFITLVYSHNVLCNYLVLDWTWRCNSRLKAVYFRLEVIHCCCVKLSNYTSSLNLRFQCCALFLSFLHRTALSMTWKRRFWML